VLDKINYYWRLLGTAISFSCFGLGGLLMPLLILPISALSPPQQIRERRVKWLIHISFWLFMRLMRTLGVCTFEVKGLEKLQRPGLFILSNHPSLIDVVLMISILPRADCVVKSSLLHNLFTRGPLSAGQYIANDSAEQVITAAGASFKRGNSLLVFPEGTRSTPNQPLKLQRGAANIAIRTANNITPVIIKCSPTTLTKQEPWYHIPARRFHISIRVEDDINIEKYLNQAPSVGARCLTNDLTDYFTKETHQHEPA